MTSNLESAMLRIGGLDIEVRSSTESLAAYLERAGLFVVSTGGKPALTLHLTQRSDFSPPFLPVSAYPLAEISHSDGTYSFVRRDLWLRLTPEQPGRAVCDCATGSNAVNTVLTMCLAVLLPETGALVLHASAVVHCGAAFVFTGTSGAGKTTALRFLRETPSVEILGDEVLILRATEDGVLAESTPFRSNPCAPRTVPVKRVFFLDRGRTTLRTTAGRATRLMTNTFSYVRDRQRGEAQLDTALRIVSRVQCAELVRPTRSALIQSLAT